jgi:hypothetical protein
MNRSGIIAGVGIVSFVFACSTPPPERQESSVQYFTGQGEQGDEGDEASCAHPICATGSALVASCDPCATNLCAQDPYCCNTEWDATCVGEVTSICGQSCTAPPPPTGPSTCIHPICATGVALASACEPCALQVCGQDPYCCSVMWDATCVGEVISICGQPCN